MQKFLSFTVIALIILVGISSAASIGINMGADEKSLDPTDSAGIVAQTNWNNASGGSGNASGLVNNIGTPTTAAVSWSATGTWRAANGNTTGDEKLMYGYIDPIWGDQYATVTLSQVPYATYDLYVYMGTNNDGVTGHVTDGTTTYSYTNSFVEGVFPGFTQTTDTGEGAPTANYAVFSGLTGDVTVTAGEYGGAGGIMGIQIVEAGPSGPGRASAPNPGDGTVGVSTTVDLSWTAGDGATSHDVYFGTTSPGDPQPNQTGTTFDPGVLTNNTTYYWRIDEVNVDGTTTGLVWSFTTAALEATNPSPSNGTVGLSTDTNLSWVAGEYALSHDIYFGTSETEVTNAQRLWGDINGDGPADILDLAIVVSQWLTDPGAVNPSADIEFNNKVDLDDFATLAADWQMTPDAEFIGNQTDATFDPGTLAYNTTYYWRVDEVNMSHPDSPWTGPVWSFTTAPETLTVSNVNPATYVVGNLAVGQLVYFDRTYTFTDVGSLGGSTYIQTANDDKLSSGDSFLTFGISQNAIVYVGYDNSISPKPSWMNTFIDTGETLGTIDKSLSLYYKECPAGNITLGGNGGADDSCSMYSVVVAPAPTTPPTQASAPNPADSATDVPVNTSLSWTAGTDAFSHDVYFGTSNPPVFKGNQTSKSYNPGTLDEYTTYYWRINEKNSIDTTTGPVWSFTTGEAAAIPRVIVSSDIGGNDNDDFQSMVHYLVNADRFDTEGLISSPPYGGRASDILSVISAYETDYNNLNSHAAYPTPQSLRNVTKQGATDPSPPAGYSTSTEGSNWIISCANSSDPRPLWVLVWGSITDVAQAVHDDPGIKSKIRVYSIGSWNTGQDQYARDYLYNNHSDMWWIENDTTFRGMYEGGDQSGDLGNVTFVEQHVRYHGALGDFFYSKKSDIKMGDTPSVLYMLNGDINDPTTAHWGGMFGATGHGANFWTDLTDPAYRESIYDGAKTVNIHRESYLRDWQTRMDWADAP